MAKGYPIFAALNPNEVDDTTPEEREAVSTGVRGTHCRGNHGGVLPMKHERISTPTRTAYVWYDLWVFDPQHEEFVFSGCRDLCESADCYVEGFGVYFADTYTHVTIFSDSTRALAFARGKEASS